jgi:hypothetical protein
MIGKEETKITGKSQKKRSFGAGGMPTRAIEIQ